MYTKYFGNIKVMHLEAHLGQKDGQFRPVVRVGPSEISIMTTDGVKAVFGGDFDRSPWYTVFWNFAYEFVLSSALYVKSTDTSIPTGDRTCFP